MRKYGLIVLLFVISCSTDNDPIRGLTNVFEYDGTLHNSPGGAYTMYNKIDGRYYYYFLVGTTAQFQQPDKNIAGAGVNGDFVRVLLIADSLDKFFGQYSIAYNDLNIVKVNNTPDTLKEGRLILGHDTNNIITLEIRATTKSNKNVNLSAELFSGTIAYRVYRKVKGNFQLLSAPYDLSRSTATFDGTSQTTITFEDDNDIFASQIVFVVNDSDNILDATYLTNNGGYVSVFNYENNVHYNEDFVNGSLALSKNQNGSYTAKFKLRTAAGDSVKGDYAGPIELFN